MRTIILCLLAVVAVSPLTGVDTTPVPPREFLSVAEANKDAEPAEIPLSENQRRTKRGIPCASMVDDFECEWEKTKPCGCEPCETVRNANEARMIRKQQRKAVAEMKINRLKRKLHSAVCPPCALAQEIAAERMEANPCSPCSKTQAHVETTKPCSCHPCNGPHLDVTVIIPENSKHGFDGPPEREYPVAASSHGFGSVPEQVYSPHPIPPHRPIYPPVMETGISMMQTQQYSEPAYDEVPMVPAPQYQPTMPQYGPAVSQFGSPTPWMRSSAPTDEAPEKDVPVEDNLKERGPRRRRATSSEHDLNPPLIEIIFPANQTVPTSNQVPDDPEDAWPFKNATYDETSLTAPPPDHLWQTAYLAASKAVATAMNNTVSLESLKSDKLPVRLVRNCPGGRCTELCLGKDCLRTDERQKRESRAGFPPIASAILTGLVSAIVGL